MNTSPHIYTLSELNSDIRVAIETQLNDVYWVCAEISEFHPNRNGHCYLELIEKDSKGRTQARQRAVIWSNVYRLLAPYFLQETGQSLAAGIKVLILVSVNFHELYGMSLTIHDINPTYTIGEAARNRAEILSRLEADGIIHDNKELPLPLLPQRIAIISSDTAAGYGDFVNQLYNNSSGYTFYTRLYEATMQGDKAASSIIAALNSINYHAERYDMVVIIRGGGSTSELACFDNYELACNIAQFPLPVIVGIGHERDETVLDHIAAVRVKTPTAAAEWLIERATMADDTAVTLCHAVIDAVSKRLRDESGRIQVYQSNIPYIVTQRLHREGRLQQSMAHTISSATQDNINNRRNKLSLIARMLPERVQVRLMQEYRQLDNLTSMVELLSPETILSRGYSLILHDNKVVKSIDDIPDNHRVDITFIDGTAQAIITHTDKTTDNEKTK